MIELGTISHGTMREEDLIPCFAGLLEELAKEANRLEDFAALLQEAGAYAEGVKDETIDPSNILNDLFDALDKFAPKGCYFGAHEGDCSDYGFWATGEDATPDDDDNITTATGPAYWASALVNNDLSGMEPEEVAAMEAWLSRNAEWKVVDIARDAAGEAIEARFTWSYELHGGVNAKGGEVLEYVLHRREIVT